MKVLVIGNSARSIVCSAKRAGHTVYALDNFCDVDTRRCAEKVGFLGNAPGTGAYELAESFGEVDAVILGPGFENMGFQNVLNNKPEVAAEINNKLKLAKKLSTLGIPHPETEPPDRASGLEFPLMIKPVSGSGGIRNSMVKNEDELALFNARDDANEFIAQEFVDGIPCSASLVGTGDDAVAVALNEQLIGLPWLTRLPFAYCGNVTPLITKFGSEMMEYAEKIACEFRLAGSNGVDFIQTENGVVVLEVNPRFQGSIDTVELSTGMNIFDAHMKSFAGELPEPAKYRCFAGKAILYANKKVVADKRLSDELIECMQMNRAADIPAAGWVVHPDEPISTLMETGETRGIVLEKLGKYAQYFRVMTED